jgi:hypothetical protein
MLFENFASWFSSEALRWLTPAVALQCIRLHCGKPILLLIDEVIKIAGVVGTTDYNMERVTQVAHCVGGLLNEFESTEFNAVITTLNLDPIAKVCT